MDNGLNSDVGVCVCLCVLGLRGGEERAAFMIYCPCKQEDEGKMEESADGTHYQPLHQGV